ncbi:M28 family peptidase [Pontibacter sp. G13]|uniref:M28 family metallopeptidase n=1 Tax=Pontibacter sp. G13 TaxID=3074898 RepID=UPI00288B09AC|nr:M28 family peptidase [Pontibacter sp. G13]WNJ16024.1 M28 family peptidase [Pontibacter sp. G13]
MKTRLTALCLTAFCLLAMGILPAQSSDDMTREEVLAFARGEIDTLCSEDFAGRGYTHDGHRKAAGYLAQRFEEIGLLPIGPGDRYFQHFPMRINLASEAALALDGESLSVGSAFIVNRMSGSGAVSGKVIDADFGLKPSEKVRGKIVLFRNGWPPKIANDSEKKAEYPGLQTSTERIKAMMEFEPLAVLLVHDKLTAAFGRDQFPFPILDVRLDSLPGKIKYAELEVTAELTELVSQNVVGMIPGSSEPDSILMISAHYDHLGQLGDAIFTGANDNASGTSMLLSLAEYFAQAPNRPRYSMVFVAFGGEETGLIGSRYMAVEAPLVPLSNISFILNLDLMGNGIDGIMAVGGRDFPDTFEALVKINDELQAVPIVKARKNAPNSDHYFFLAQGVKGFFIYTLGGPTHYHDIYDNPTTIELSRYAEVRSLLIQFLTYLQR